MKKLMTAILSLSLLGAAALPSLALESKTPVLGSPATELIAAAPEEDLNTAGFSVELDGEQVNARALVMVPLRALAEKLGFTVTWDNRVVTVTGPERYIRLTVGKDEYFAAPTQEGMMGASLFSLGCAPCVTNGTTYVPVEVFDALLGCREGAVALEGNTVKIRTDPVNTVQIPNPFADCATLEEAAKAAGFELAVPEKVNGSSRQGIQVMAENMIQVFYGGEENEVCIRKAPGTEDISGDYNRYAVCDTVSVGELKVTMKGEEGQMHLATWTDGGYTYSIGARTGMSSSDMSALVQLVK